MEDLNKLITAYINEKSTNKLLLYNPVVEEFNLILKNTHIDKSLSSIVKSIKEIEIERISYFIKEYILTRLDKIKSNLFLDTNLMNDKEKLFYNQYLKMLEDKNLLTDEKIEEPEYVGFYCMKALNNVKLGDEIVEINIGDFFVANIEDVIDYLKSGHITLV